MMHLLHFFFFLPLLGHVLSKSTDDVKAFDWARLEAAHGLNYTDCYDGFQCAKLLLPLDWLDADNENQVSIAIIKLPATVDVADPSFGGPILFNPGGPSVSGLELVRRRGHEFQHIVDGQKHFDLVSFDPRGVRYSEPNAHCFADTRHLELFNAKQRAVGWVDEGSRALRTKWAASHAQALLCASPNLTDYANGDNIRNFMSTPSVARDMLAITEAEQILHEHRLRTAQAQTAMTDTKQAPLLQYWGFSYGTILGATFLNMFPDRVGRVVLDGVADTPDYYVTAWSKNLQDTEQVWASFYTQCFDAGSRCPLYRQTDHGPEDIERRMNSVLETLQDLPIPVADNGTARLITYEDVRTLILDALYRPYFRFPPLATAINDLLNGNYTSMLAIMPPEGGEDTSDPDANLPWQAIDYNFGDQVQAAISCGDGPDLTNTTIEEFEEYLDMLMKQSPTVGAGWARIRLACVGWKFRPKWRFEGPFTTGGETMTANPVLIVGNTGDPVTPLRNAATLSERHEGSVLLTLNTTGHCSFVAPNNECATNHIRAYFNHGTLPTAGTICPSKCVPWMESPCESDTA